MLRNLTLVLLMSSMYSVSYAKSITLKEWGRASGSNDAACALAATIADEYFQQFSPALVSYCDLTERRSSNGYYRGGEVCTAWLSYTCEIPESCIVYNIADEAAFGHNEYVMVCN